VLSQGKDSQFFFYTTKDKIPTTHVTTQYTMGGVKIKVDTVERIRILFTVGI
jgi:hypothetical protein